MAKSKSYQSHKSKPKSKTIQWPKVKVTKAINQRTDNTMAKRKIYQSHKSKDRQYNGQK